MSWPVYLVSYYFFAVGHSVFSRWFAVRTKLSARLVSAVSYTLGVLPVGLAIGLLADKRVFVWNVATFSLLFVIGLFISVFGIAAYDSKKLITVTNYLTLSQLYVLVATLLGWALLGEKLTPKQVIGGIIMLVGCYLAIHSAKRKAGKDKHSLRGSVLAAISGIALGIVLVAEKAALGKFNAAAYFIVGYGVQALGTTVAALPEFRRKTVHQLNRFELTGAALTGFFAAMGGFTYISVLNKLNNIGFAILLTTFQMPLSIIVSHFWLKEKDNGWLLVLAATLSFIGLLVVAL